MLCNNPRRDLHAYTAWLTKCEDRESARYHAVVQHKLLRQQACQRHIHDLFCSGASQLGWLHVSGTASAMLASVTACIDAASTKHHIKHGEVVVLPILNWGAPSLIKSENMKSQAQVLAALLHSHGQDEGTAAGVIFTPAFSYTRGGLYKQLETQHSLLANCRANFDTSFCLPYGERTDERDQRPIPWF